MVKDVQILLVAFVISIVFFSALTIVFGGVNQTVVPARVTPVVLTPVVPGTSTVEVTPAGPARVVRLVKALWFIPSVRWLCVKLLPSCL